MRILLVTTFAFFHVCFAASVESLAKPTKTQQDPSRPMEYYDTASAAGSGNFNTAWKGFAASWKVRQGVFAKTALQDQNAIVFLGDSITEHVPLVELFGPIRAVNRGVSGDTSRGMLLRLSHNVLALKPTAVVLLCGTNDLFQPNFSTEGTTKNVQSIVEKIHEAYPKIRIAVLEVLPMIPRDPNRAAETIQNREDLNASVTTMLKAYPYVIRVPTTAPFINPDKSLNTALFKDGVHPNAQGYQVYQSIMKPVITELLQK